MVQLYLQGWPLAGELPPPVRPFLSNYFDLLLLYWKDKDKNGDKKLKKSVSNTCSIWQAGLTLIHSYWYQQFHLLISTNWIVDIKNSIGWYQHCIQKLISLAILQCENYRHDHSLFGYTKHKKVSRLLQCKSIKHNNVIINCLQVRATKETFYCLKGCL